MKKANRLKTGKKIIHVASRSQPEEEYLKYSTEDALSTMESPIFYKQSTKIGKFDEIKKNGPGSTLYPGDLNKVVSRRLSPKHQKAQAASSPQEPPQNITKEQEKIIKLQETLILNLKNEIETLEYEKNSSKPESETFISLKNEANNLEYRISSIYQAYKKDLRSVKQTLIVKEDQLKELKLDFHLKLKTKDMKIDKLERKLEKIRTNSKEVEKKLQELDDVKVGYDKEKREKKRLIELNEEINEKLRLVSEENRILIQNYTKVQSDFQELENKFNLLRIFNSKTTKTQLKLTDLIGQFENINKQNQILNEKLKVMSERNVLAVSENADFRKALLRAEREIEKLKKQIKLNQKTCNLSQHWNGLKTLTEMDCLNVQTKFSCDTGELSLSGISVTESQLTHIEQELNTVKALSDKLMIKEIELNEKLKKNEEKRNVVKKTQAYKPNLKEISD